MFKTVIYWSSYRTCRLQEVKSELDDTRRSKEQLERVTYQLVDELRTLKSRVDAQSVDFASVSSELKNKSRRLEEDNRQNVSEI